MPHNMVCGKPWKPEIMLQYTTGKQPAEASSLAPWLPVAEHGFKQSPALLQQLSLLKKTLNEDYVVSTSLASTLLYNLFTACRLMNQDNPAIQAVGAVSKALRKMTDSSHRNLIRQKLAPHPQKSRCVCRFSV